MLVYVLNYRIGIIPQVVENELRFLRHAIQFDDNQYLTEEEINCSLTKDVLI